MEVMKRERKFTRYEEYVLEPKGWLDEGDYTSSEELRVVRIMFEDANMANMRDDGHELLGSWRGTGIRWMLFARTEQRIQMTDQCMHKFYARSQSSVYL